MILGSHNSWSFLTPKKWWMRLLKFMAKCQRVTIKEQYELGVRCFDLRLKCIDEEWYIVHNSFIYCLLEDIEPELEWLNNKGDVVIRVIHDVRKKEDYILDNINGFIAKCIWLQCSYDNIKFWCGRNLYNLEVDFDFKYKPYCLEKYSSVCPPRIIDDWLPIIYAKFNNHEIRHMHIINNDYNTILLLDFIDIL